MLLYVVFSGSIHGRIARRQKAQGGMIYVVDTEARTITAIGLLGARDLRRLEADVKNGTQVVAVALHGPQPAVLRRAFSFQALGQ